MRRPFRGVRWYVLRANEEFTRKYQVDIPWEATRRSEEALMEWCALVRIYRYAFLEEQEEGESE